MAIAEKQFTRDPVLAAFDDPMVQTFGNIVCQYGGWSYVTYQDGVSGKSRVRHFSVRGSEVVKLDFSGFREMPVLVFEMMVQLGFPRRGDLAECSHFELRPIAPLNHLDVERIWLWRRAQQAAAQEAAQ